MGVLPIGAECSDIVELVELIEGGRVASGEQAGTRAVVAETGVLAKRQRRALDSTVLDDAVTRQGTLMQLTPQIRVVRRRIPAARALQLSAHDYKQGGAKPACAWNDPADINRVVTELVSDATTVLDAVRGSRSE